jgi:leucyl-tRNA synthetase
MICVNELTSAKCHKRAILEPLAILIAPYAPHIAEEVWHAMGHDTSICDAEFPVCNEAYLVESTLKYPVSFNGKVRFTIELPANSDKNEVEKAALENEQTQKYLDGKTPKRIIVVPGKIINIVL